LLAARALYPEVLLMDETIPTEPNAQPWERNKWNHTDLLAQKGKYYDLWSKQSLVLVCY
jgi:hypothetical protein